MTFKLPSLPYACDALESHIDQRTMKFHHDKHHNTCVTKLNAAVGGTELEHQPLADTIVNLDKAPGAMRMSVHDNGGGHFDHSLSWEILSPDSEEKGGIVNDTKAQWSTLDEFENELTDKATTLFGSGWAWLVVSDGKLETMTAPDQDSPLTEGKTPILLFDVWEHACYLKYQSKRPDYVTAFRNIINRKKVDELYQAAK